jgi:hypothetical protein
MTLQQIIKLALRFATLSCILLAFNPLFALPFAAAWAGTAAYGFVRYGLRGWPTMIGAPFVLYPLLIPGVLYFACAVGKDCI